MMRNWLRRGRTNPVDAAPAIAGPAAASLPPEPSASGEHGLHIVEWLFRLILGRAPDEQELLSHLQRGGFRTAALTSLLRSDEFADRYRQVCPQTGFLPRDVQLCELANPAKWDNPEWLALLRSLQSVPSDKPSMHRKGYEFTQLLYGLTRLKRLQPDVRILSVGAGHEPVLYWLANRVGLVVATDLYEGSWQAEGSMEGNTAVLIDPSSYAPFAYDKARLVFLRMNGLALAFPDAAFDVVYSLSSVEHFAGLDGAKAAVAEMARVLRPGGILALATEYCLDGPVTDRGSVFTSVMAFLERVEGE